MNKTLKINHIAIDKTGKLCYNDIMKNKGNKMIEHTVTISNHKFDFTPSLRCVGVTYPNGRFEVIHVGVGNSRADELQKANEIVGNILKKNRDCS